MIFVFQLMTNVNLKEMEWVGICEMKTSGSGKMPGMGSHEHMSEALGSAFRECSAYRCV
jgi:hypothetical protein